MCLSRNPGGDKFPSEHVPVQDDLSHTDHPSAEQFRMLLNLLPPQSLAQVRDLDSIRYGKFIIQLIITDAYFVNCNAIMGEYFV